MSEELAIRLLDPSEIGTVVDWAAEEGWNPGLDDAAAFRSADPDGFLGLFVDGSLAASVSAVIYNGEFSFVGFYICRRDLRGHGYGRRLWDAALARLDGRTIGLDGVVAQQGNYAAGGFAFAHRNIRYSGPPSIAAAEPDRRLIEIGVHAPASLLDHIVAYDRPLFPGARSRFVRSWIDPSSPRRTLAFVEDGSVHGYGTIRPCRSGFKIGPLFADSGKTAATIFAGLTEGLGEADVILDVPEPNDSARRLAESHGLAPSFETARMYRGPAPRLPLDRIYGITTFELG